MTNYPTSEPSYDPSATASPGYPDQSAATPYPVPEAPGAPTKQKKPRRWVAMVLVGVLAFIIGIAAGSGGGSDDVSDSTTAAGAGLSDDADVAELESDRDALQGELESVTAELETIIAERDDLSGDLEVMTEERDTALASAEEAEAEIREADAEAEAAEEEEAQAADAGFGDGSWRIGEDIEPGTYRSDGGGSCYWERLSGFSGELDDIIANDLSSGPTTVTIAESDAGFTSQRCGTWELQE